MIKTESLIKEISSIIPIINDIKIYGGITYLVGGAVRDIVLDKPLKDIDIEVHGITLEQLETILKKYGPVDLVGKQFGVLRLHPYNIDWSLPRADSIGRKPTIAVDPSMTIQQACRRRDVTMNAMAIDLASTAKPPIIIDPFNGQDAIAHKELRYVDRDLFCQDPLRFFRVMHFIGRFEMNPDKNLNDLCSSMDLTDPSTHKLLARERIFEEIKKLFLLSQSPSRGFRWLASIKRLHQIFPELHALIGIKQRPDYHPEGDVFEHTMQAIDAASRFTFYQDGPVSSANDEKFVIMLAVLCHDLGKVTHTDEHLCCRGHETAGIEHAKKFITRISNSPQLIKIATKLVEHHTAPYVFIQGGAGAKAYKRLAAKLAPYATMRQLGLVALADLQGRSSKGPEPLTFHIEVFHEFIKQATLACVAHHPEPPILLGRHLMDVIAPGPVMGDLLKKAYEIQIGENINDWQELKRRVLSSFNSVH